METGLMERVLSELARFEIAASDHARAIAPQRSRAEAEHAVKREQALQDVLKEALFLRNRDVAREPVRAAALRLGVEVAEHTEDWQVLAYEATRVLYDLSAERMRRDQGVYAHPSPYIQAAVTAPVPAVATVATPQAVQPMPVVTPAVMVAQATAIAPAAVTSPAAPTAPLPKPEAVAIENTAETSKEAAKPAERESIMLSEAFKRYGDARLEGKMGKRANERADLKKGESYKGNSHYNLKATAKLIVDIIGDKPVSELTEQDFTEAFTIIQRVPKNHGKSSRERRTMREIVECFDLTEEKNKARVHAQLKKEGASPGNIEAAEHQESIERLRVGTVYRHMQEVQRVLRYMIGLGYLSENLMENVIWSKREQQRLAILQDDNSRKVWGDELPKLFRTPIFQGELEDIGDPMFWAPLIAVHHGLRAEEVLQPRVDDVRAKSGIDYFDRGGRRISEQLLSSGD